MRTHHLRPTDDYVTVSRLPARIEVVRTVARVLDYAFGVLYTLLFVRLVLAFFGARPETGFVQLIRRVTQVFYAPFEGIFPADNVMGGHIVWSLVVAIVAYMVLHAVARGLLRLVARA